jgi:hypothetical protein
MASLIHYSCKGSFPCPGIDTQEQGSWLKVRLCNQSKVTCPSSQVRTSVTGLWLTKFGSESHTFGATPHLQPHISPGMKIVPDSGEPCKGIKRKILAPWNYESSPPWQRCNSPLTCTSFFSEICSIP